MARRHARLCNAEVRIIEIEAASTAPDCYYIMDMVHSLHIVTAVSEMDLRFTRRIYCVQATDSMSDEMYYAACALQDLMPVLLHYS